MKKVAFLILLALAVAVSSCGTGKPSTTVTTKTSGNWEARLLGGTGAASQLNFVTQFSVTTQNGGSSQAIDTTGFGFINATACFLPSTNQSYSGQATLNTNSSNQVSGSMTYTVTSGTPAGDVLTLTTGSNGGVSGTASGAPGTTGTLSNGVIWGTWTLQSSNPNCPNVTTSQNAPFVMCQGNVTCTIP